MLHYLRAFKKNNTLFSEQVYSLHLFPTVSHPSLSYRPLCSSTQSHFYFNIIYTDMLFMCLYEIEKSQLRGNIRHLSFWRCHTCLMRSSPTASIFLQRTWHHSFYGWKLPLSAYIVFIPYYVVGCRGWPHDSYSVNSTVINPGVQISLQCVGLNSQECCSWIPK